MKSTIRLRLIGLFTVIVLFALPAPDALAYRCSR
jgi:hypothetical protein